MGFQCAPWPNHRALTPSSRPRLRREAARSIGVLVAIAVVLMPPTLSLVPYH